MRAGLGTYEVLRRLGFPAEDLFIGITGRKCMVHVHLRTQGKEFLIALGSYKKGHARFAKDWTAACLAWNAQEIDRMDDIYENCEARVNAVDLMMAMYLKGIVIVSPLDKVNTAGGDA